MSRSFTENDYWSVVGMLAEIRKADASHYDRLLNGLADARTLRVDVEDHIGTPPQKTGRGKGQRIIKAVCSHFYRQFGFSLYEQIFNSVKLDDAKLSDQSRMTTMIGHYKTYMPDSEPNKYRLGRFEIMRKDDMFFLNDHIRSNGGDFDYSTLGQMYLIRERIHILFVEKYGLRTMILQFEKRPSQTYVKGIVLNVTYRTHEQVTSHGEEIFASQFLAVHETNKHYGEILEGDFIAKSLESSRARPGVIFV